MIYQISDDALRAIVTQSVVIGASLGLALAAGWRGFFWFCEWVQRRSKIRLIADEPATPSDIRVQQEIVGRRRPGFTLVELLIVCSIISILASMSYAGAVSVRRQSIRNIGAVTKKFDDMAKSLPDFQ